MNYNFRVISNLSSHERKLALNIKNVNSENRNLKNFRIYLDDIPNIMNGLKYIHEFSNEFTILLKPNQKEQYQAFYDVFLQLMPKSIGKNVKINYYLQMNQNWYNLKSISFWKKQNQISRCFDRLIMNSSEIIGFCSLQNEVDIFRVLVIQYCLIGGDLLMDKQRQYLINLQIGKILECDRIKQEFLEMDIQKIQRRNLQELKINNSAIFDSRMFQGFNQIKKLSIKNSSFNSFTLEVFQQWNEITELKMMNYYVPNIQKFTTAINNELMTIFQIPTLKTFKNLRKLSFYLLFPNDKQIIKQTLEENFNNEFELTLYNQKDLSLNDKTPRVFF